MNLLDPEELEQLLPAETHSYPGPIPTQSVSSDEFMPYPQTAAQRRVEARILGEANARLYKYERRSALAGDRMAALRREYEEAGPARSNLRYGYVVRPPA